MSVKVVCPPFSCRKWLCQFYGRLGFFGSFCKKTSMPIKFLVLGGGGYFWFWGGEVPILFFMGAGIFLTIIEIQASLPHTYWSREGHHGVLSLLFEGCHADGGLFCLALCPSQRSHIFPSLSAQMSKPHNPTLLYLVAVLASSLSSHQNRTIAIASDFHVDGAKSPEILQKEGVGGSEIAARNRKSLAALHRTLKSQCIIASSCPGTR